MRGKIVSLAGAFGVVLAMAGCASKSDKIAASYASPLKYKDHSCQELEQEYVRLSREAAVVFKNQDNIAERDTAATAVGVILFWPALFLISGNDKEGDVARLKGELNAVEDVALDRQCTELAQTIRRDRTQTVALASGSFGASGRDAMSASSSASGPQTASTGGTTSLVPTPQAEAEIAEYWSLNAGVLRQNIARKNPEMTQGFLEFVEFQVVDVRILDQGNQSAELQVQYKIANVGGSFAQVSPPRCYGQSLMVTDRYKRVATLGEA